jgi:hypothetical protein
MLKFSVFLVFFFKQSVTDSDPTGTGEKDGPRVMGDWGGKKTFWCVAVNQVKNR